jgi:hypothetical protein
MKPMSFLLGAIAIAASTPAIADTITVLAGANAQHRLRSGSFNTKPGDIVAIKAGHCILTEGLSLTVYDASVIGVGADKTILSVKNRKRATEGLIITSDDVPLKNFMIEDSRGLCANG